MNFENKINENNVRTIKEENFRYFRRDGREMKIAFCIYQPFKEAQINIYEKVHLFLQLTNYSFITSI